MELEGKVVVVTGAGNGIGAAAARRFAAEGAKVVVGDIEAGPVTAVAEEVGGVGLAGDVTQEADVQALAALAREHHGRIDVWFSNAGVSGPNQIGNLQDEGTWDMMWHLHVMSHVYASQAVLPEMLERGDGYLLQTCSSVALSAHSSKVAYSVTKHAALSLGEWLHINFRNQGVKVSCFCPGAMRTRMLLSNNIPEDSPIMQMATSPEDVADLLVKGMAAERFLILTHDSHPENLAAKGTDYDAWLGAMLLPRPS